MDLAFSLAVHVCCAQTWDRGHLLWSSEAPLNSWDTSLGLLPSPDCCEVPDFWVEFLKGLGELDVKVTRTDMVRSSNPWVAWNNHPGKHRSLGSRLQLDSSTCEDRHFLYCATVFLGPYFQGLRPHTEGSGVLDGLRFPLKGQLNS